MQKYRKKPVVIEAQQWNHGNEPLDCMKPYGDGVKDQYPAYNGFYFINTLEGKMHVSDGVYIIKGVDGEFYPCKPDIFKNTYDEV